MTVPLAQRDADVRRVMDYWTPDRLKAASSYATPARRAPQTSPSPTGTTTATSADAGRPTTVQPTRGRAQVKNGLPTTVGKVFFRIGDRHYFCSATAVHSPNRNLVATAAHCAYDVQQMKPVEDWIFIPGYTADGRTEWGIYVGHTLNLHDNFAGLVDWDYERLRHRAPRLHLGAGEGRQGQPEAGREGQPRLSARGRGTARGQRRRAGFPVEPAAERGHPRVRLPRRRAAGRHPSLRRHLDALVRDAHPDPGHRAQPPAQPRPGVPRACSPPGRAAGPGSSAHNSTTGNGYLNGVNSRTWDRNADRRYDHISSPSFTKSTYVIYKIATTQGTG